MLSSDLMRYKKENKESKMRQRLTDITQESLKLALKPAVSHSVAPVLKLASWFPKIPLSLGELIEKFILEAKTTYRALSTHLQCQDTSSGCISNLRSMEELPEGYELKNTHKFLQVFYYFGNYLHKQES